MAYWLFLTSSSITVFVMNSSLVARGMQAVAKYLKRSDTHVSDLRLDDNNFADEGSEARLG